MSDHQHTEVAPARCSEAAANPPAWTMLVRCQRVVRGRAAWLCAAATWFAGTGCTANDREIDAFVKESEASVSSASYRVEPPDILELSSAQSPEIDGEQQTVRQDGKITLRLIGEVKVAGLTPPEISRKLESLLEPYYVDPQVNARVVQSASKRYFVFGDGTLTRQGAFPYTGRETVLNALAMAGPNVLAWRNQIKLVRPSENDNQRHVLTLDVDRMVMNGQMDQNVLIQEGDIVWVPPTPMAWLGLRLSELLVPMLAASSAATAPVNTANAYDENP